MTDREQTRRDAQYLDSVIDERDRLRDIERNAKESIERLRLELVRVDGLRVQAERDRDNGIAAFNELAATADRLERERDEALEREGQARRYLHEAEQRSDMLVEALREIAHIVKTRSTGVRMDGSTEWPTPMHKQVYELADTALGAFEQEQT